MNVCLSASRILEKYNRPIGSYYEKSKAGSLSTLDPFKFIVIRIKAKIQRSNVRIFPFTCCGVIFKISYML